MMPLPGSEGRCVTSQARRLSGDIDRSTPSRSDARARPPRIVSTCTREPSPARPSYSSTSATTRAFAVAVVARTGVPSGSAVQQIGDPATIVGAEVVPPVRDAVRLVDHDEPASIAPDRAIAPRGSGIVEPLRTDEQHVDLVAREGVTDLVPVLGDWPSSSSRRGCRPDGPPRSGRA